MKIDSRDLENAFYTILERDHEFNDPRWSFAIKVRDVQGKTLIDATFRFRTKGKDNEFNMAIQAKRAVLRFDIDAKIIRASFDEVVEIEHFGPAGGRVLVDHDDLEIPIPPNDPLKTQQRLLALAASPPHLTPNRRDEQ